VKDKDLATSVANWTLSLLKSTCPYTVTGPPRPRAPVTDLTKR
jgi:hypothetical protein